MALSSPTSALPPSLCPSLEARRVAWIDGSPSLFGLPVKRSQLSPGGSLGGAGALLSLCGPHGSRPGICLSHRGERSGTLESPRRPGYGWGKGSHLQVVLQRGFLGAGPCDCPAAHTPAPSPGTCGRPSCPRPQPSITAPLLGPLTISGRQCHSPFSLHPQGAQGSPRDSHCRVGNIQE